MDFFPYIGHNLQKYVITRYIDREMRKHVSNVSDKILNSYNNRVDKELLSSFTYSFDKDELYPNLPYTANIIHFIIEKLKEALPKGQFIFNKEKESLIILAY